ncbi:MAG TPA: Fe3+/spermidine/putrescine ABC transporter ATP-binding protein, partial [Alphaproteobacteria bacterium]|nr:Fe3+/spermidine/putrescine ABC transporter ATP-binding protein [Alphaproteobacteria bacterium]
GPSGCGKTTLLRMIAGFEIPTEGEIFIDGAPSAQLPPYRRPTNMVFQSYAIFPHLTVADNIAYGLRRLRLSTKEINRRVEDALDLIKLPGLGKRRADQLSGGQRQRIALARALILQPKVLLLDEPLGALDKKLRDEMQIELRLLQRRVGITFVFVTHDQEEALSLSDRIAVMHKGKVAQIASPKELYESPNSILVASFIGNINLIAGRVRAQSGEDVTVEAEGLGTVVVTSPGKTCSAGSEVTLAVRPEKLEVYSSRPVSGPVAEGRMGPAAYLGDRSNYQVMLNNRTTPLAVSAQNYSRTEERFEAGQAVFVTWAPDALLLFANGQ